jgi:hypothetical protein
VVNHSHSTEAETDGWFGSVLHDARCCSTQLDLKIEEIVGSTGESKPANLEANTTILLKNGHLSDIRVPFKHQTLVKGTHSTADRN